MRSRMFDTADRGHARKPLLAVRAARSLLCLETRSMLLLRRRCSSSKSDPLLLRRAALVLQSAPRIAAVDALYPHRIDLVSLSPRYRRADRRRRLRMRRTTTPAARTSRHHGSTNG